MITVICRKCNEKKQRIPNGRYKSKFSPRYRDENGKLWNGKECNDCSKLRNKLKKREQRAKVV